MSATLINDGKSTASLYGNKDIAQRSIANLGKDSIGKAAIDISKTKNADLQEFVKLFHESVEKNPSLLSRLGIKLFAHNYRPDITNDPHEPVTFEDKILEEKTSEHIAEGVGAVTGSAYLFTSTSLSMGIYNMIGASVAFGAITGVFGGIVLTGMALTANILAEVTLNPLLAHHAKNIINKMPDEEKEKVRAVVLNLWTGGHNYNDNDKEIFIKKLNELIPLDNPDNSLTLKH